MATIKLRDRYRAFLYLVAVEVPENGPMEYFRYRATDAEDAIAQFRKSDVVGNVLYVVIEG